MNPDNQEQHSFLRRSGSETGKLMRNFNWAETIIGKPNQWPQSLRTMAGVILHSNMPMLLWWGTESIQFYNDAYLLHFGNDSKHPPSLGQAGSAAWPEVWPDIKPILNGVLASGEATNSEACIFTYKNGQPENVSWTFNYSAVLDASDNPAGVLVTCTECNTRSLEENNEQLHLAIEASQLATWELNPNTHVFTASTRLKQWFGLPLDRDFDYTEAVAAIPEKDRQRVADAITYALQWESGGHYEVEHSIINPKTGTERIVKAIGLTRFDAHKNPLRFNGTIQDITIERKAALAIEESERNLLSLFEESPVGIATMSADEQLLFKSANAFYCSLLGRKAQEIIGKPLLEALPEITDQGFDIILKNVISTGKSFAADEVPLEIMRAGKLDTIYVNLTYQPRRETGGRINGVLVVATDVTQQVLTRNDIEASERKLRAVIAAAPAGISLFAGPDLIIEHPNQTFIDILGKGPDIAGLPLREAMPELLSESQPFLKILENVLLTGVPFTSHASFIKIVQNGIMHEKYYNISYTPVLDATGKVYAILDISVDVTAQIQAQQKLEEAEASMRGAVELAKLGTWSIDVATNGLTYSDRLIEWFGYDPSAQDYNEVIPILQEKDQARVANAVAWALNPASGGVYDETYTVIHPRTGKKKILHAQGKTVFDLTGKPVRMNGTAQDITIQRELQLALESEVQVRTEELAAANEELQAINEELEASNSRLIHSNEELAQYAYVASHDLQEPLRKIRVFSSMLNQQIILTDDNKLLVKKIEQSAERMTLLIKDLLDFSRLINSDDITIPIDLNDTLKNIITDFELILAEKHAKVIIDPLPVVEGVTLQMNQLFYNLLSNALKFSRDNVPPEIRIGYKALTPKEAEQYILKAETGKKYFDITVKDNGIGFEVKYAEQIFEVFKRLHGKELYPGSGIGLALCRRIVAMHGGALYPDSEPGTGSIFHIILHN